MTLEYIQIIALLCSFSSGGTDIPYIQNRILNCHRYYLKCSNKSSFDKCVKRRDIWEENQ